MLTEVWNNPKKLSHALVAASCIALGYHPEVTSNNHNVTCEKQCAGLSGNCLVSMCSDATPLHLNSPPPHPPLGSCPPCLVTAQLHGARLPAVCTQVSTQGGQCRGLKGAGCRRVKGHRGPSPCIRTPPAEPHHAPGGLCHSQWAPKAHGGRPGQQQDSSRE
jgi:hypothetical protein